MELQERTLRFAASVVRACRFLPKSFEGRHVADQLFRAATSVAANYRASCRARSRKEFAAKIGLVVEETDETKFWLTFAIRITILSGPGVQRLTEEADELVAIFYKTRETALQHLRTSAEKQRP
jgi:four helix bundle protein